MGGWVVEEGATEEKAGCQGVSACVICRLSWLPRSSVIRVGYRAFNSSNSVMVSTLLYPRSTKSPCGEWSQYKAELYEVCWGRTGEGKTDARCLRRTMKI